MKTYIFNTLTTGLLRDGINVYSIMVTDGKAQIDDKNPAIVALAEKHGGKPVQTAKPAIKAKRSK